MLRYRLSAAAQADIIEILAWTQAQFGAGVRSWHLGLSRAQSGLGTVRRPRHFLIYRFEPKLIIVGRVLHDAMELARHLDPEASWEQAVATDGARRSGRYGARSWTAQAESACAPAQAFDLHGTYWWAL